MDINTHIEDLRHEVETAVRTFYAFDKVMQLMSEQYYVDLLNKNLYFWKITISSLQTKMFIALGRLYDDSNDAFSFHSFMKICRDNISEFNRANFERRRQKGFTDRPDWLDDYLKDAYFADIEDIHKLSKLAQPHNKRMKGLYKEIRSKVFAHAIHTDDSVISNLFERTNHEEIENALKALWSIYSEIWQMYHNARKPVFEIREYPHKDEVHNCIKLAVTGRV